MTQFYQTMDKELNGSKNRQIVGSLIGVAIYVAAFFSFLGVLLNAYPVMETHYKVALVCMWLLTEFTVVRGFFKYSFRFLDGVRR